MENISSLTPDQQALLALRLRKKAAKRKGGVSSIPTLEAVPRTAEMPVSFAQQRLWFLEQFNPGSSVYNIPFAIRLAGNFNPLALEQSLNEMLRRHEILRTTFTFADGQPAQIISPSQTLSMPLIDLSGLDIAQREATLKQLSTAEAQRMFDLRQGPLLRATLLRLGELDHVVLLSMHHIVSDGWSIGIVIQEVATLYQAYSAEKPPLLSELPIQYADFAYWQRQWMQGDRLAAELSYWKRQLDNAPPLLNLPADRTRPPVQSFRGASQSLVLSKDLSDAIRALTHDEGVTMFMLLLGAFQTLLHRYTGQNDISVGTVVAGRNHHGIENLIGLFLNSLVLRIDLSGNPTFRELLRRVRTTTLEGYDHQDVPFEKLVDELQPERNLSYNPLFQVMLIVQNTPAQGLTLPGLKMTPIATEFGTAKLDLTLTMEETETGLIGSLEYSTDLFKAQTITRMLRHFETLLGAIVSDPDQHLHELNLLTEVEQEQILFGWNETQTEFSESRCLHKLFEEQAARTPESVALVFGSDSLTYRELNERANQLAHHLRSLGAGTESVVALLMERSFEMVVSILAVLKAGSAYLPLDPSYPSQRLSFMLSDAQPRVLLRQRGQGEGLTIPAGMTVLEVDAESVSGDGANPEVEVTAANLAYVIYTSGSTGQPKGVMITHGAISNRLLWMTHHFCFDASERIVNKTSFSFDASLWELFVPLLIGGRLVLARPGGQQESDYLVALMAAEGITTAQFVPSMLGVVVAEEGFAECGELRRVFCGGEVLSRELTERFRAVQPEVELHNLYGPTEAAIDATHWSVAGESESSSVPIGRPIANMQMYVLDEGMRCVPVGVSGELYIGGVGLARGYQGRAELTAERFVPHPYSREVGARLYRTGDVGRYLATGELEYQGRVDSQVKVRGYRIELGEIEAALRQHEAVRDAVVVVQEDENGHKRLVSYLIGEDEEEIVSSELRTYLGERLPEYMVPGMYVWLKQWPVTSNGKVDRRALSLTEGGAEVSREQGYAAARNPVEEKLVGIWEEVLGVETVGIHDNFFELGGDSIISLQIGALAMRSGIRVTARKIFQYPTIAELAAVALQSAAQTSTVNQDLVTGPFPLTPIQHDFLERKLAEPDHYNQSLLLQTPPELTPAILNTLLRQLMLHHDSLRLRVETLPDGSRQASISELSEPLPLSIIDLSALPQSAQGAAIETSASSLQASLDVNAGPIMRVVLYLTGETGNRLLIIVHHLAIDGVSWRILLEDVQASLAQLSSGEALHLPAKTTSFKQWAELLQAHVVTGALESEVDYWVEQAGAGVRDLVPQWPIRPAPTQGSAVTRTLRLSAAETRALLLEAPAAYHTQINDLLLTALALAVREVTGESRLRLELEGHGREEEVVEGVELGRTIGWFTTLFPVLLDISEAGGDLGTAVRNIKGQLRAIPQHGIGYGLLKYLGAEEVKAKLRAAPRAALSFNYLGQLDQVLNDAGGFAIAKESAGSSQSEQTTLNYALEINGSVSGGRLSLDWTFSPAVLKAAEVEKLKEAYGEALRGLIKHCAGRRQSGYTPSDFSLSRLGQEELDRLVDEGAGEIEDIYPLSPLQEGLLFHTVHAPGSGVYVQQMSCRFGAGFDAEAFKESWRAVVQRHGILRTGFAWERIEEPVQVVRAGVELEIRDQDWSGLNEELRAVAMASYLAEDRERGFRLQQGPLMRLALMKEDNAHFSFVWSFQHLVLDGWSIGLLIKEVFENYEAAQRGAQVKRGAARPYRDYIQWLRQQDVGKAEQYWRKQLHGMTAPTPLGIEPVLTALTRQKGQGEQGIPLGPELRAFARQQKLTLNTVIQGAWALLLSRYSEQSDVVFGAVVSGRPDSLPGVEEMIGLFINTLPVRVHVADKQGVGEWLRKLQDDQGEMRQYEYSSLVQVQGWSEVPRGLPLFESILVFENFPAVDSSVKEQGKAFEITDVQTSEQTNYPLTILASSDAEASLTIRYDQNRFDDATITRMLGHFETLLAAVVSDPDQPLSLLPLLTADEEHQVVTEWNLTQVDYSTQEPIHELFAQQAARTPDAVALVFGEESLTYRQLNERANQLAHHLRSLGVGAESVVGVLMERSFEMVISLLAVLKAGAAYLPLDPSYPVQRLSFMLEDAQPLVLLVQQGFDDLLTLECLLTVREHIAVVVVDEQRRASADDSAGHSSQNHDVTVNADNIAYLIYTSGSTGQPKGVMVSHRAILNRLLWMQQQYQLDASDVVLQKTPFTFDVSVWEFFWPLLTGARLVVARPGGHQDARYLLDIIEAQQITTLHFVPSMLQALLAEESVEQHCRSLRRVICSGEALVPELVARYYKRLAAPLENLYGPTEAAVDVTRWRCESDATDMSTPIGRPIANIEMYVLDHRMRAVPIGVCGELYIGGVGLARGYRGRAGLTAERFVPHPYSDQAGARLYRTGDIGRYRPAGEIEYQGRADYQVKVRGYRIELGEIEAVLRQHEAVSEVVVIIREDKPDDKRVVAYLVAHPGFEPAASELRSYMKEKLPQYMLPQAFVMMDALPLSANGKVARDQLPEPERALRGTEEKISVAPTNSTEVRLLQIWENLFGIQPIGIRDDFFDLGGHSILALRLMASIQKQFNQELPLATLLAEPTIERLARILRQQSGDSHWSPLVAIQPAGPKRPFFCVHPSGGNVFCYVELSHQLGVDQPFYGLQDPPSLDGSRQTYDNIEEMAARYNEVVRAVQPAGPYYLGGYSFGGLVAFEMAQQLRRQNQEVALLALIDTATPQSISRVLELEAQMGVDDGLMLGMEVLEQASQAGIEAPFSLSDLWQLQPHERLNYAFAKAKEARIWPPEIDLSEVHRYLELHKGRRHAIQTYHPQPLEGQLTLLRTSELTNDFFADLDEVVDGKILQRQRSELETTFRNPTLGWEQFSRTPVEVQLLEGDHHSILVSPHVKTLAKRLQACIAKATTELTTNENHQILN